MLRWIAALAAVLTLTGCVTERVVYRDRYHDDYYAGSSAYADRYAGDGSYYSPSYSGRGDYYYGSTSYSYGYDNQPSWYWDYPAYYSVFWPMYRSWYDPYWYPNYYYGVTYYPRNYFSVSFNSGWGASRYSNWYYSPYRYSWVDNYYDWSPWYGHSSRHRDRYQTPRYGSARNEAERLSRQSDWNANGYGANAYGGGRYDRNRVEERSTAFGRYGTTRSGARGADYGSQPVPRQLPNERGFGVQTQNDRSYGRSGDVRRTAAYGAQSSDTRQLPNERGFGVPVDSRNPQRDAGYETNAPRGVPSRGYGEPAPSAPRYSMPQTRGYDRVAPEASREAARYGSSPSRSYDTGVSVPRRSAPATSYQRDYTPRQAETPVVREYSRPAPVARGMDVPQRDYRSAPRETYVPQQRSYASAPAPRSYDTGGAAPRFESRPEPRSEPRFESRPEPRSEPRSESRSSSDDGGVRRVGSNRDED
jgi:hypothetical protein